MRAPRTRLSVTASPGRRQGHPLGRKRSMTKLREIQQRRGFRVAIIFALACMAVAIVGKTVVAGDAPLFTGLRNEQQIRADSQKQFREIHSDRTGRFRPDLLSKGIAQAQRLPISAAWRSGPSVKGSALANPSAASPSSAVTGAQWVQYGPAPLRPRDRARCRGA